MVFAEPGRLVWLAVPAALALAVWWRHRRRLAWQRSLASPSVWDRLMGGTPATGLVRLATWCGAAALLILALARPQWGELPSERSIRTRDLVVALDVSDSMRCPDVKPSRLESALQTIRRALPLLDGNRVGVVVFAGEAYPLIPLTTDLEAAAVFLDGVEAGMVARPGSNLEQAVAASLELLPAAGEGRVVVLVTDGENLQGDPEVATAALEEAGVQVVALLAGTDSGGPIPIPLADGTVRYKRDREGRQVVTRARPDTLSTVADGAGGRLLRPDPVRGHRELAAAVEALRTREAEVERKVRRVERFPVFLAASAVLLIAGFGASPWRRRAAAMVLAIAAAGMVSAQQPGGPSASQPPPSPEAAAGVGSGEETPDEPEVAWWQRWIPGGSRRLAREGQSAWRDGDPGRAAEAFAGAARLAPDDPVRVFDLGTAVAADGEVDRALTLLEEADGGGVEMAAYNAGTAALEAADGKAAVRWLRQALLAHPESPEVKRNYELALRLLQQQEQQQQQQQQKEQPEDQEKDEEDDSQSPDQPQPDSGAPTPTPTPDPHRGVLQALARAEAEAREELRTPTPVAPAEVEEDW